MRLPRQAPIDTVPADLFPLDTGENSAAHGRDIAITDAEAYSALSLLLRFVIFASDRRDHLSREGRTSVMPPRVDEDGESYAEERHERDQGVAQDSSEDHTRRVRSDGQHHYGPPASQWARARERREAGSWRQ